MTTPASIPTIELAQVGDTELEIHDQGSGEPVVFIHTTRDEWYAVLAEPVLAEHFRLIHCHRRGYGNSSTDGVPLSSAEHAADCRAVMTHLGIERAHVAALSGAGTIQLQLALDHPEVVHNLKGEHSTAEHQACHDAITDWIPHAENALLPDTGHAMPQTNPTGTAEVLAGFFARHPIRD